MKKLFALALFAALGGCMMDVGGDSNEQLGKAAQSVVSNTVSATFILDGAQMTVKTGDMPKGWFTPQFSKSPITVSWSAAATNCNAAASGSFGSGTTGSFTAVTSPSGYSWSASQDLSGFQNHWHKEIACNGTVTVVGCNSTRTINYTLSVGGSCKDSCSASGSVSLPAIQDPNISATNCVTDCDSWLEECVSACQANCGNGASKCSNCCECMCKKELHRKNSDCVAPQSNCYVDNGNHGACL